MNRTRRVMIDNQRRIGTEGGYIEGQVSTEHDFAGRDINVYNYPPVDLGKVVEVLKRSLPRNDPLPARLLETLKMFRSLHARLAEWKELHNYLCDVIMTFNQFSREVEQLQLNGVETIDPRSLIRRWRPVRQRIELLLEWSKKIVCIGTPYSESGTNGLQGERWSVRLSIMRNDMDSILRQSRVNYSALYELTQTIDDEVNLHMYLADKSLRDTASQLNEISEIMLGSLQQ
jgi:hypothetical protein